jgi:CBS domain-containing protein
MVEVSTPTSERRGRINKRVGDVMHTGVVTCDLDTSIPAVAQLMTQHDVSAIPVVDGDGHLAGIITRTDLVTLRGYDDYWRELKAEEVMVHDVHTVRPDQTVAEASRLMTDKKIHRLIVCEDDGGERQPIGVIAQADIVRDMSLED